VAFPLLHHEKLVYSHGRGNSFLVKGVHSPFLGPFSPPTNGKNVACGNLIPSKSSSLISQKILLRCPGVLIFSPPSNYSLFLLTIWSFSVWQSSGQIYLRCVPFWQVLNIRYFLLQSSEDVFFLFLTFRFFNAFILSRFYVYYWVVPPFFFFCIIS